MILLLTTELSPSGQVHLPLSEKLVMALSSTSLVAYHYWTYKPVATTCLHLVGVCWVSVVFGFLPSSMPKVLFIDQGECRMSTETPPGCTYAFQGQVGKIVLFVRHWLLAAQCLILVPASGAQIWRLYGVRVCTILSLGCCMQTFRRVTAISQLSKYKSPIWCCFHFNVAK